jgi:hypothetical protein
VIIQKKQSEVKNYSVKFLSSWKIIKCSIGLVLLFTTGYTTHLLAQTPPVLKNLEKEVVSLSTSGRILLTQTITVEDTDSEQLVGAEIRFIEGTYQAGIDQLTLSQNQGSISGSWNSAEGVLTLSGTDTKENYQAALRSITYTFFNFLGLAQPEVNKISISVSDGTSKSESVDIRF